MIDTVVVVALRRLAIVIAAVASVSPRGLFCCGRSRGIAVTTAFACGCGRCAQPLGVYVSMKDGLIEPADVNDDVIRDALVQNEIRRISR